MDPSKSTRRNTDKKDKAAKSLLPPKLSTNTTATSRDKKEVDGFLEIKQEEEWVHDQKEDKLAEEMALNGKCSSSNARSSLMMYSDWASTSKQVPPVDQLESEVSGYVADVKDILKVSPGVAQILLLKFSWNKALLLEKYNEKSDIQQFMIDNDITEKYGECMICWEKGLLVGMTCRHFSCFGCWKSHLKKKTIDEITCMHVGCQLLDKQNQRSADHPSCSTSFSGFSNSISFKYKDFMKSEDAAKMLFSREYTKEEIQTDFPLTFDETKFGSQNLLVEPASGLDPANYFFDVYRWNQIFKTKVYVGIENNHVKLLRKQCERAKFVLNGYYSNWEDRISKRVCWLEALSNGTRCTPVLVMLKIDRLTGAFIPRKSFKMSHTRPTPKIYKPVHPRQSRATDVDHEPEPARKKAKMDTNTEGVEYGNDDYPGANRF